MIGRYISGLLAYVGNTRTTWSENRQSLMERSTYGNESIADKSATEALCVKYLLRSWDVTMKGLAQIIWENEGMTKSFSLPNSELKKKCTGLSYHRIRE